MIKKLLYILLILLFAVPVFGANHWVTQSGAGDTDGSSLANAWSVAQFNALSGTGYAGDTFYFSGAIASQISPGISGTSGGGDVTLDGWEGGTCDPVADSGCASAVDVDVSGSSTYGIYINGNSYLTIQDFDIKSLNSTGIQDNPNGATNSNITVRRNYIHDCYKKGIQLTSYNNTAYLTIGGASGNGNYVYDCDLQAYDSYSDSHIVGTSNTSDMIISYNKFVNDPSANGGDQQLSDASNVLSIHTAMNTLVEYNTIAYPHGQACIAKKEYGGTNLIIRFNKLYGCGNNGGVDIVTNQASQTNYYIYGNLIYSSAAGIRLYRNFDNMYIWSNVLHDFDGEGEGSGADAARGFYIIPGSSTQGDVYFYNNTVVRGDIDDSDTPKGGGAYIYGESALNLRMKNNIFANNNTAGSERQVALQNGSEGYISALDYNTYYSLGDTPTIYWTNSHRTLAWMVSNTSFCDNNNTSDPLFADPNGADNTYGTDDDDYTLQSSSPAIDDGVDLSECFNVTVQGTVYTICYDDALDPNNTDWTTTPPTVAVVDQDSYGTGWERGAYAATGPIISDKYPTSQQSCDSDPQTVTMGVTSSENANCKYSAKGADTCSTAFADLDTSFSTGEGTTSHSTGVSQACDGSTTYVVICQGTSTSLFSNCLEITVDVAAGGGEPPQPAPVSITSPGELSIITGGNVNIN